MSTTPELPTLFTQAQQLAQGLQEFITRGENRSAAFARTLTPQNLRAAEHVAREVSDELTPGADSPVELVSTLAVKLLRQKDAELEKCKKILLKVQQVRDELEKILP